MNRISRMRAYNIAATSMIIGIVTVVVWFIFLLLYNDFGSDMIKVIFFCLPPIAAITGLVFGVLGLVFSLPFRPWLTRGIAFSSIGIVLNLIASVYTCYLLWMFINYEYVKVF